ncbi:MAG: flavodoxin family protein [Pseudomonadota bacterium]|nr:flavodoxin family protein [Pseudomonadota bacterium]
MSNVAVVYFSGYGHTQKQAEAVHAGVQRVAGITAELVKIDAEGQLTDAQWQTLEAADGIIFGAPTYMGGAPWQFKKFADASSKPWYARKWQDKLAAGFTNSASMNGDKGSTLLYLVTLASQHGMLWVSLGVLPSNSKAAVRNDINFLGGSVGLLAQSPSDSSPEEGPLSGDLETAQGFGQRFAEQVKRLG